MLKEHFDNALKNAKYNSKTIQNEIIDSIGGFITDEIIKEVKHARIFSIIADETPDVSRKEQTPFSLRYVGKDGITKDKFLLFIECDTGTSAVAIAGKITKAIFLYD